MAKRMLTPEEKSRIVKARCNEAVTAHPDKMIFVRVDDETDENGDAIVRVHFGRHSSKDTELLACSRPQPALFSEK